jgi:hypothetical protein
MDSIHEPNDSFQFDKLQLISPVSIPGGHHFIRYLHGDKPLYAQPPKCKIKQGIVKAGKRMYCDLMFTNENENFIRWLENLDNTSQKAIFTNRKKWFETDLDEHDIENSFTSPLKTYKSGKYYIVRANIPIVLGKPNLRIYDDNENLIDIENIQENDNVATILEFQGIKCSPRNFQIEIELKQLLVLKPVDLFEKCVFKIDTRPKLEAEHVVKAEPVVKAEAEPMVKTEPEPMVKTEPEPIVKVEPEPMVKVETEPKVEAEPPNKVITKDGEMEEVEIPLEEIANNDTVFIKKRNDVYYQMYREALQKAKMAKSVALASYLEAKRIKNTYMLTDLNDDDDDDSDNDNDDYDDIEK